MSVSRITRGPFQNGGLGYWVVAGAERPRRRTAAVGPDVASGGFGEAGLHRLEAATLRGQRRLAGGAAPKRLTEIGLWPRYLFIAGAWRDHLLFARTAD